VLWRPLGAAGLGLTIGTPVKPQNLNRRVEGLRVTAGLPDVRLHDLRHAVVSLLLDLGTPPHVDITMAIYAHTNLEAMRQALDAIEWEDLRGRLLKSLLTYSRPVRASQHHQCWSQRWPGAGSNRRPIAFQAIARTD
jgi:hypothetical protein